MKPLEFAKHEEFIFVSTKTIEEYEDIKAKFSLLGRSLVFSKSFDPERNTVVWIHRESLQVGDNEYKYMYSSWGNKACFMTYREFIDKYCYEDSVEYHIKLMDEHIMRMEKLLQ